MTFERDPINLSGASEQNEELFVADRGVVRKLEVEEVEKQMFEINEALELAKKALLNPSSEEVRIVAEKIVDAANSLQSDSINQPGLITALRNFVLKMKEKGVE